MKKRIISLALVIVLALSLCVPAAAASIEDVGITYRAIKIDLNGKVITPCDAAGNTVDPQALYEGDYKVSFGMKDAKTGKLISSDLLGNPKYQGSYYINGQEYPITHEGFSGSADVPSHTPALTGESLAKPRAREGQCPRCPRFAPP